MLIRWWDEPSAVRNLLGSWDKFVTEFRLVTPHIRPALTPALLEEVAADPKEKYRGVVAATQSLK